MARQPETAICARCGHPRVVNTSRPGTICSDCKFVCSAAEQRLYGGQPPGKKPLSAAEIIAFAKEEGILT